MNRKFRDAEEMARESIRARLLEEPPMPASVQGSIILGHGPKMR